MPDTLTGLENPPVMPEGVRVIRTLVNEHGQPFDREYPVRLLYSGVRDGIHYWTIYWHKWIEPGDRVEVDRMPPETAITVAPASTISFSLEVAS
jgi:hypothetical protein